MRPPEEVPALLENLSRHQQGRTPETLWRHRKKDGTVIDVEVSSYPVTFAGREGRFALAHDVTDHLKLGSDVLNQLRADLPEHLKSVESMLS